MGGTPERVMCQEVRRFLPPNDLDAGIIGPTDRPWALPCLQGISGVPSTAYIPSTLAMAVVSDDGKEEI